jgi:peptide/nickel transport system substrate-binding protein
MKKFVLILLSLIVVGSLLLVACTPTATETPAATAESPAVTEVPPTAAPPTAVPPTAAPTEIPTPEVIKGGTLHVVESGLVQFDPPFIADDASMHVCSQIYSYLFRLTADGEIMPDLAESWEYSTDNKTITFHLKSGYMWQDGNAVFAEGQSREVTAEDVAYSLDRSATIEGSQTASDFLSNYESVEVIDTYTVALHLKAPDALLFVAGRGLTGTGIIPKEAVEFFGDSWNVNPIGSGPWELKEYVPDDHFTLVPNEDYYIQPNLDQMVYQIIPDETVAAISMEAGDVQIMGSGSSSIYDQFASNPDVTIIQGSCPYSFNLQFAMADPIFSQIEVRQAMAHAIDGRGIVQAIVGGMYVDGCGTAGPGIPGYDETLCDKYFTYDTALAEQILTDAGWAKNADGIWAKGDQTLTFAMEAWNMTPMPDIATAVLTQLQEFGMSVELVQVEFGTWINDYFGGTGKPIMFWSGFCGDGGLNGYWGRTGLAASQGYSDEEVFTLLDNANSIVDPTERNATLMEATDKIFATYPDIPLSFAVGFELVNKKVQEYGGLFWFQNIVTDVNNVWLLP